MFQGTFPSSASHPCKEGVRPAYEKIEEMWLVSGAVAQGSGVLLGSQGGLARWHEEVASMQGYNAWLSSEGHMAWAPALGLLLSSLNSTWMEA